MSFARCAAVKFTGGGVSDYWMPCCPGCLLHLLSPMVRSHFLPLPQDFLRSLRKFRLFLSIFALVSGLTLCWFAGLTSFSSDMISVDGVRDLRWVLPAIPSPSLCFAGLVAWSCLIFSLRALLLFLYPVAVSLKMTRLGGEAGASSSDSLFVSRSCLYPSSLWGSSLIWALVSSVSLLRSGSSGS